MIIIYPRFSFSNNKINKIDDLWIYYTLRICDFNSNSHKCLFMTINKSLFKEQIYILSDVNFQFTKFYKSEIYKIYL